MRELLYYEAKLEALREIIAADSRVHYLPEGTGFMGLSPQRTKFGEIARLLKRLTRQSYLVEEQGMT